MGDALCDKDLPEYAAPMFDPYSNKDGNIAFNILEPEANVLIGYQKIRCHLVFDVKVDSTHKARLVVGRYTTKVTEIANYSSVVERESV